MKDIRVLPDVLGDLSDAADWYDKEGYQGLGDRFLAAFQAHLTEIQKQGEINRIVYFEFGKILLRPFPYKLFYRLHEETWMVVLVIHAAREPGEIKELLSNRAK